MLLSLPSPWSSLLRPQQQHFLPNAPLSITTTTISTLAAPKRPSTTSLEPGDPSLPLYALNPSAIYKRLKALAWRGDLPRALHALDLLSQRGVPVNATAFSHLLRACARSRSLPHARALHAHLRSSSLDLNPFLLSLLVLVYAACGSPSDARLALSLSRHPPSSPLPWNALLRGHLRAGPRWGFAALDLFDEMRLLGVHLDDRSYSSLLEAISASPSTLRTAKAHALMLKSGFLSPPSVALPTALMGVYFRCCKVTHAVKVLDEMPHRDVVVWGAAISGFAFNGMRREALDCARWMAGDGTDPNWILLTTLLPVIGDLSAHRLGREVHGFALKRFPDYPRRKYLFSGLIDMYSKCGDITSARRVFYSCQNRNVVVWTALISGYSSNGRLEQALRAITWMQKEGIKPDLVSTATALPVCAKLGAIGPGKELHAYMLKRWLLPTSVRTSLMTTYSACGRLDYSWRMFNGMERRNAIAWTAMMDSFLRNGCPLDALGVFRLMQLSKHRPDSVAMARGLSVCTELQAVRLGKEIHGQVLRRRFEWMPFVAAEVVRMYGRCGEVALARRVFDGFASKGPLTGTVIVDAYGYNGLYGEALELFDQMVASGFVPNQFTFDAVLSICGRAGLPDKAVQVYDLMVCGLNLKASEEHYGSIVELLTISGWHDEAQRFAKLRQLTSS